MWSLWKRWKTPETASEAKPARELIKTFPVLKGADWNWKVLPPHAPIPPAAPPPPGWTRRKLAD